MLLSVGLIPLLCVFFAVHGAPQIRNALTDPSKLWEDGRVPYQFHGAIDAYRKVHIMAAMKQVSLSLYSNGADCISFFPHKSEPDYIEFQFTNNSSGGSIGRAGGKQPIFIRKDITQDNIVQSLMFALGVYPEVARADRDNVLIVDQSNINPAYASNFQIEPNTGIFRQPFDYDTVVMYGPYQAALNRSFPTIKTKYDGFTIGEAVSLSPADIRLVQHVYNCPLDSSHRVDVLGPFYLECHFHFDFCQFTQDYNDDFDWVLKRGPTDTPGTGPMADHSSGSGTYAVAIAKNHNNKVSRLISPTIPAGEYCFVTFLHMYGANMGTLYGMVRTGSGPDRTVVQVGVQPQNFWYHGSATIRSKNDFQMVLEAAIGNGDVGDIAIDDVYIYKGECIDWF